MLFSNMSFSIGFLEYVGVWYVSKVRITAGDTRTEEYKRMNPLCKVLIIVRLTFGMSTNFGWPA